MQKLAHILMSMNYLTSREAAQILGVSVPTVRQWIQRGLITAWKTEGGHRRITHDSVKKLADERPAATVRNQLADEFHVLVVEDDATLLQLYRHQLKRWPFKTTVFSAPNGYEALVLMGEAKPSLLICDLRLPGVTGFQIVRALCTMPRFRDIGIVVISGMPMDEIDAHGGLPSRVKILGKPVDFALLAEIAITCRNSLKKNDDL